MRRFNSLRYIAPVMLLLVLIISCSHGADSPAYPDLSDGDKEIASGTVSLGPVETIGNEISIPVEFSGVDDLYALSLRVGFDSEGLVPVNVEWSGIIGEEDATFQLLDRKGFLPLAFARLSGMPGIKGEGTLCTLRFSVIDPELANPWIISDEDYLVAYNAFGSRLNLETGGESR